MHIDQRGHLIANLDPLGIEWRVRLFDELTSRVFMVLKKTDYKKKYLFRWCY